MLLNSPFFINANTDQTVFTITPDRPASDLSNFVFSIQLSQMPISFWNNVRLDGGNIRAFNISESTEYPLDIITINPEQKVGTICVRVPGVFSSSSDTQFKIKLDPMNSVRRSRGASTGMAAVWQDYEAVFMGGEYNANRAKTSGDFEIIGDVVTFDNVSTIQTFTDDPHQGIAWDRETGDLYTFDNNKIVRYNAAGTVLATNSNPSGDVETLLGIGTLGHVCDGCIFNNWIVIPINNFPTDTLCAIAVFNKTTLALVTASNVSSVSVGPDTSGICVGPGTNKLFTCYWNFMSTIRRWSINPTTGAVTDDGAGAALNISFTFNDAAQGIEFWNGSFWISDDSRDEIVRLNADGTGSRDQGLIGFDENGGSVTGNFEGICAYKDGLAFLVDPTSANSYATYARPRNIIFGGGGARYGTNDGYIERNGLAGGTTFTMAVSAARSASKQASLLSYRDFSSGLTNDRATLAHRFVTPNYRVEMWDNVNSWITISSPVNTALNTMNRIVGVYSGTTRTLYCDGTQIGTQTGITARDVDFDCLSVGIDDETLAESFDGNLTFAYVRLGALSAAWIAAEHSMISDPAGFFVIS